MSDQNYINDLGDMAGQKIGQYEVDHKIGQGGMATVYLGHQRSMGREVAIKIMPAHLTHDPNFLHRFEREVKVIAKLQHPRILPVYDYGQVDSRPYIVMAYMPGGTLSDLIKQGPMDLTEVVRLVGQIAEGLDHAHREGVIHRDFKPSNVLLDKNRNTYLADFGIAKISEATIQLTGSGIVGTPAYMAPEMADQGTASPSCDLYALGITLYEMVTGRFPYQAETPLRVMMAHATEPVPDPREIRPDLSEGVAEVIKRSMAKSPAERHGSGSELVTALRAAVQAKGRAPTTPSLPKEELLPKTVALESLPRTPPPPSPAPQAQPHTAPMAAVPRAPTPAPVPYTTPPPAEEPRQGRRGLIIGGVIAAVVVVIACVAAYILVPDLLGGGAPATEEPAVVTVDLIVENQSDRPICYLYVSPSDLEDWGPDKLGSGSVVTPGQTFTLSDVESGVYDFKVEDCEHKIIDLLYTVNLDYSDYTWMITTTEATLTIVNNSSTALCYLYISSSPDNWGPDQLGAESLVLPDERISFTLASGTWNLRGENCDHSIYWELLDVGIATSHEWTLTD